MEKKLFAGKELFMEHGHADRARTIAAEEVNRAVRRDRGGDPAISWVRRMVQGMTEVWEWKNYYLLLTVDLDSVSTVLYKKEEK